MKLTKKPLTVHALRVPTKDLDSTRKLPSVNLALLKVKGVAPVVPGEDNQSKLILLTDPISVNGVSTFEYVVFVDEPSSVRERLKRKAADDAVDVPSSFETIGHIAHVNISARHDKHKHDLAQGILDNNKHISIVVGKVGELHGVHRTYDMEVLAKRDGVDESNLRAKVIEDAVTLELDIRTCYWNSRLSGERSRLLALLKEKECEVLIDVCAGVGGLCAIAGSKHRKTSGRVPSLKRIIANDINPSCAEFASANLRKNLDSSVLLDVCNTDCSSLLSRLLLKDLKCSPETSHSRDALDLQTSALDLQIDESARQVDIVCNLPESSVEVLSEFGRAFRDRLRSRKTPAFAFGHGTFSMHLYFFHGPSGAAESFAERVDKAWHLKLNPNRLEVHRVRDVAPNKYMYRADFSLADLTYSGGDSD